MTDTLTTYAVRWMTVFNTIEEFEEFWSTLMENEIDCLVDSDSARRNYNSRVFIHFRTIKSRDTAISLRALIK